MNKTQIEQRLKEIRQRQDWLRDAWNYPPFAKVKTAAKKAEDDWYDLNKDEDDQLRVEANKLQRERDILADACKMPAGAPLTVVLWAEQHLVKEPKNLREKITGWTENGLVAVYAPGRPFWNGIGCGQAYSPTRVEIYQISKPRRDQGLFGIVKQEGRVSQKRLLELFKEAEKKVGLV